VTDSVEERMSQLRCAALVLVLMSTACSTNEDSVDLSTMQGNDSATVVLNGRRASCVPYEVTHGSPKASFENFLSSQQCPSEVAVFAKRNAMGLVDTVSKWTDAAGDVVAVPMRAPYSIPVNILIMSGDLVTHNVTIRMNEAASDVTTASQLFDDNQCGISFAIRESLDETHGNFGFPLLTATCKGDVASFKAIDTTHMIVDGLNVFYYDGVYGTQGETCADGNSAIILISKWSSAETLAHELGHALSLQHTNDMADMPAMDLMLSPSPTPTPQSPPVTLTAGQCFRTNVDDTSALTTLSIRPGSRPCAGTNCPPLSTHR